MKIVRFEKENVISYGRLENDEIIRLQGDIFGDFDETGEKYTLNEVKLIAPIEPINVVAIGLNYKAHADEGWTEYPSEPVVFVKTTNTVIGPDEDIIIPRIAPDEVDYEAELAIVVGKRMKDVSEADVLDYVLGYTCANDVTARDCQFKKDKQWARAKSFDTFCPLGPCIQTDMEPDNTTVTSRLNGRVMQQSNTSDMIFSCRGLLSFLSECMTLLPATVILTGTPAGVGFARKPPVFLKPGDTIEVEIENIGILKNTVISDN